MFQNIFKIQPGLFMRDAQNSLALQASYEQTAAGSFLAEKSADRLPCSALLLSPLLTSLLLP